MAQRLGTCHACRKRRLWCDSKSPSCSQCLLTGRECPGYQKRFVIQEYEGHKKGLHTSDKDPNAKSLAPGGRNPLLAGHLSSSGNRAIKFTLLRTPYVIEGYASAIVYKFTPTHELSLQSSDGRIHQSRLCGTWMRLIPDLAESSRKNSGVLYGATRALAAAISLDNAECGTISSARESYLDALHAMRNGLTSAKPPSKVELLATIMCLSIVEVMLGDSSDGFTVHADGISQLMIDLGPNRFTSGSIHHLFVAFQPIMVCLSVRRRKSTFLDQSDWNSIPFRIHSGSPLNSITTVVSGLPRLLEELDWLCSFPTLANPIAIQELSEHFRQLVKNLSEWAQNFNDNDDGPVYWPSLRVQKGVESPAEIPNSPKESICLCFANTLAANAMTHYWAFKAVALLNLHHLYASFSDAQRFRQALPTGIFEECVELCTKICQSMEYHLQDEMKIFGPTSAFFPLRVSHDFFNLAGPEYSLESAWCTRLLQRIISKGCRISSFI